jgi:hypothetical protein
MHALPHVATTSTWQTLPAALATAAAIASAIAAYLAYHRQNTAMQSDALFRAVDRLESSDARNRRSRVIYDISRDDFASWSDDEREAVHTLAADLDFVALLVLSGKLDMAAFFSMYGDVMLRSAYKVAPYANSQRDLRGSQFLLPLSRLLVLVIVIWRREAHRGRFPWVIGIPQSTGAIRLVPRLFTHQDADLVAFIHSGYGRKMPITEYLNRLLYTQGPSDE